MKKGIALFLTLIFISIIIIIVGKIFNIYEKFSNNNFYKNISQNSILIRDIKNILDNLSKDINKSNIKKIFKTFPISSKDGNFRALITITPITDKININKINQSKKYLENILEYYQISDPIFFKDLILDTLDLDTKERSGGSEIILQNPFFKQGKIYNIKHLKKIIDYYYKITNDENIYKIPWEKLFSFDNDTIDKNLISNQVSKFLELNLSSNTTTYPIKINILYNEENISLIYDLKHKKIKKIIYYPIY